MNINVSTHRFRKGFTLVELLVVIAIIGILATLVLLQLGTARARARDTQRISHINQIRTSLEQYYEDNQGNYPTDITDISPRYIQTVPTDPLTDDPYGYAYENATDTFHIYACLENNASALNSDIDLDSTGLTGDARNNTDEATTEACTTHGTYTGCDCFYDTGISN